MHNRLVRLKANRIHNAMLTEHWTLVKKMPKKIFWQKKHETYERIFVFVYKIRRILLLLLVVVVGYFLFILLIACVSFHSFSYFHIWSFCFITVYVCDRFRNWFWHILRVVRLFIQFCRKVFVIVCAISKNGIHILGYAILWIAFLWWCFISCSFAYVRLSTLIEW